MEANPLYAPLVGVHAIVGILSLLSALVPLFARKGRSLHRRAGWVFTLAMLATSLSGVFIAAFWLIDPLATRSFAEPPSPEKAAAIAEDMRVFALLLLYLVLLIAGALWQGLRAIRARKTGVALGRHPLDRWQVMALLIGGVALLVVGLRGGYIVHSVFGGFGAVSSYFDLRFLARSSTDGRTLIVRHLQAMLGAFIAATTAFAVLGSQRWMSDILPQDLMFVPWVAPLIIGIPLVALWQRRYRRPAL